jgi:hypothetical protein
MNEQPSASRQVKGTIEMVLPRTGLVYLMDESEQTWVVTKGTKGVGIDALEPGQHLMLTVAQYPDFAVVSEYAPLD